MKEVFADTFFWTALANPRDRWHEQAVAFRDSAAGTVLVTTDEVLVELAANLAGAGPQVRPFLADSIESILKDPGVRVIPQSRASLLAGLQLYRDRPDKSYSLTDCISMQVMRKRNIIEALTADHHFTQEGFRVLFRKQ
jgi:predicted nucleic acid-binding protein